MTKTTVKLVMYSVFSKVPRTTIQRDDICTRLACSSQLQAEQCECRPAGEGGEWTNALRHGMEQMGQA